MTLLAFLTDHRFIATSKTVRDRFGFSDAFWRPFLEVSDSLVVVGREDSANRDTEDAVEADSTNSIDFRFGPLAGLAAAKRADAVWLRLPATIPVFSLPSMVTKLRRGAVGFELVGDPAASILADKSRPAAVNQIAALLSRLTTRFIVSRCQYGTYVASHLRETFPAQTGAVTEIVSSVRLGDEAFAAPETRSSKIGSPIRIVCVASLIPVKNHVLLIDALKVLNDQGVEATLTLVGSGPLEGQLKQHARAIGVEEQVLFRGQIAEREVLQAELDDHDIFALASTNEGMPRSVIEAMSRSLVCVALKIPATQEILPEGLLFADANGLSELVKVFASDQDECTKVSNDLYRRAREFSYEVLAAKRARVLSGLIEEAHSDR